MFEGAKRRLTTAAALLALAVAAHPWQAGAGHPSAPEGDAAAGKVLAEQCAGCHGPAGVSDQPGVPHLAGQHATYLWQALQAYRDGTRAGEAMQAMKEVVAGLDDSAMADLVAYFASLEPFTTRAGDAGSGSEVAASAPLDFYAAGKAAAEACAGCHGEDGNSDIPGNPGLAGQHDAYIVAALQAYKDGKRVHDEMQAFAEILDTSEMEDIARYYSALKPVQAPAPEVGDPFAGRAAAEACAGCHGEDGNTRKADTPRLAGLDAESLVAALEAYRDGTREHEVMREAVAALSESEIVDVAAFYASKEPHPPPVLKPLTIADWADRCDRCHGPDGNSSDPRVPILAGQSKDYLVEALKLYHSKLRENSMMFAMSFPMGETDIEKLASYYAGKTSR